MYYCYYYYMIIIIIIIYMAEIQSKFVTMSEVGVQYELFRMFRMSR